MPKFNFTDSNGKTIETSLHEMTKIKNDTENISNGSPVFIVSIQDENGQNLDVNAIKDSIKDGKNDLPNAIDVTYEVTHSGANKNYSNYTSESLRKDAKSWMEPYAKPLIKNHDLRTDPFGRVVEYSFCQSKIFPEKDCICVTFRVTDQNEMMKFIDGRYSTVSIGGSANKISCNICGKNILNDGVVNFCGHWKGETYPISKTESQVCIWTMQDIEYMECSVVNSPADGYAQQTGVKIPDAKDTKKEEDNNDEQNIEDNNNETNILDSIDSFLDDSIKEDEKVEDKVIEDEKEIDDETNNNSDDELTVIKNENETLKQENLSLNDKIKELESQINELNKTAEDNKKEIETNISLNDQYRKSCIDISYSYKQLLIDHLLLIQNDENDIKDNYIKLSVKDIQSKIDDKKKVKEPRKTIVVESPIANNQKDSHVIIDNDDSNNNDNKEINLTLDDFTDNIINSMISKKNCNINEEEY